MERIRTGIVTGGKLNLREQPTTQSKHLTLIPDGAQISYPNTMSNGIRPSTTAIAATS